MPDKRVLCVEDDADTRDMLKTKLGLSDFEVVVAPDVESALHLMERERFSLYVLDGGLRGHKGPSLCEHIRASDARTPIVIFSGHAYASDIEAGMLAGRTPTSSSRTLPSWFPPSGACWKPRRSKAYRTAKPRTDAFRAFSC